MRYRIKGIYTCDIGRQCFLLALRDFWIYIQSSESICNEINADILCITFPLNIRANAVLVFERRMFWLMKNSR